MSDATIAFEENGLRNLEAAIKQKDCSPEERERLMQEFYTLASQLRATHQAAKTRRQARLN